MSYIQRSAALSEVIHHTGSIGVEEQAVTIILECYRDVIQTIALYIRYSATMILKPIFLALVLSAGTWATTIPEMIEDTQTQQEPAGNRLVFAHFMVCMRPIRISECAWLSLRR